MAVIDLNVLLYYKNIIKNIYYILYFIMHNVYIKIIKYSNTKNVYY